MFESSCRWRPINDYETIRTEWVFLATKMRGISPKMDIIHPKYSLESLANFNLAIASYRLEFSRAFLEQSYQSTKLEQFERGWTNISICLASKCCIAINWGFPILNFLYTSICNLHQNIAFVINWVFPFWTFVWPQAFYFKLTSERDKVHWAFAWNTRPLAWVDLWGSSHFVNTQAGKHFIF